MSRAGINSVGVARQVPLVSFKKYPRPTSLTSSRWGKRALDRARCSSLIVVLGLRDILAPKVVQIFCTGGFTLANNLRSHLLVVPFQQNLTHHLLLGLVGFFVRLRIALV